MAFVPIMPGFDREIADIADRQIASSRFPRLAALGVVEPLAAGAETFVGFGLVHDRFVRVDSFTGHLRVDQGWVLVHIGSPVERKLPIA